MKPCNTKKKNHKNQNKSQKIVVVLYEPLTCFFSPLDTLSKWNIFSHIMNLVIKVSLQLFRHNTDLSGLCTSSHEQTNIWMVNFTNSSVLVKKNQKKYLSMWGMRKETNLIISTSLMKLRNARLDRFCFFGILTATSMERHSPAYTFPKHPFPRSPFN